MTAGVYRIANVVTGRVYVGSSINVDGRRSQHFSALRHGKHCNAYLQNSWNKHGSEVFSFALLEAITDVLTLACREQLWLSVYSLFGDVYNLGRIAATPTLGRKLSEEHRLKLSVAKRGKKLSEAHRRNIGLANVGISRNAGGRAYSVEERAARSLAMMGNKWSCGYKQSEETKRKRIESRNLTKQANLSGVAP